jgi:hypothetical protein
MLAFQYIVTISFSAVWIASSLAHHAGLFDRSFKWQSTFGNRSVDIFEFLANNQSSLLFGLNVPQECDNGEVDCAARTGTHERYSLPKNGELPAAHGCFS